MEELFNNILVLIPVALLIFLRVFAEGARKRAEKARTAATATGGAAPATPARPEPQARPWNATPKARPQEREPRKEKAKPSAGQQKPARRDLLGRLRDYLSGNQAQPTQHQDPLHFEEEASRRLGQFGTQATGSTGTKVQALSGYREGLPGAMEESVAITRASAPRYAFPGHLERLPPLKRAIVLSEVLGKPKSMQ